MPLRTDDFNFELPQELIAQHPSTERGNDRLLVLHREDGRVEHRRFADIDAYLTPGDALVLNNTKVIPARLFGFTPTGAKVELFLHRRRESGWECLVKPGKRLRPGTAVHIGPGFEAKVTDILPEGLRLVEFVTDDFWQKVQEFGHVPLPPYIHRADEQSDHELYQTVYARHNGSVAAPTAGLHFTAGHLDSLRATGINVDELTLHVGLGTFRPVTVEYITDHKMHSELCQIDDVAADRLNRTKAAGGKIVAVGTTSCRTLESFAANGKLTAGERDTDIFIYPGKKFEFVDALLTNFHLPGSTLIMLVCALAGRENVLKAYRQAVEQRYRFFSYGDAMLII